MKHVILFVVGLFCYSVYGKYWCFFFKNILRLTSNCIILLCLCVFWSEKSLLCAVLTKKITFFASNKKVGLALLTMLSSSVRAIHRPPHGLHDLDGSGRRDKWMAAHDLHRDLARPSRKIAKSRIKDAWELHAALRTVFENRIV